MFIYQQECCRGVYRHYFSPMSMLLYILAMVMVGSANAQDLKLRSRINGEFDSMTTDNLGQLYLHKGGEIKLYSKDGEMIYRFSDLSYGRIGGIDTRNSMKVLVFYPDFSRITFLDNTLSKNREQSLRLDRINLSLVQLVCISFDNGFWAYDPVYFRLLRFDQHLNVTNSIENVNQLVGDELDPTIMVEEGDWLYLNDPKHGIFRFDIFGTYSKLIPVPGVTAMQVRDNGIFLTKADGFYRFDPILFQEEPIELPVEQFRAVRLEKQRLYVLDDAGVSIFHFEAVKR